MLKCMMLILINLMFSTDFDFRQIFDIDLNLSNNIKFKNITK